MKDGLQPDSLAEVISHLPADKTSSTGGISGEDFVGRTAQRIDEILAIIPSLAEEWQAFFG